MNKTISNIRTSLEAVVARSSFFSLEETDGCFNVRYSETNPLRYQRGFILGFVSTYTSSITKRTSLSFFVFYGREKVTKVTRAAFFRFLNIEEESGNYHAKRIEEEAAADRCSKATDRVCDTLLGERLPCDLTYTASPSSETQTLTAGRRISKTVCALLASSFARGSWALSSSSSPATDAKLLTVFRVIEEDVRAIEGLPSPMLAAALAQSSPAPETSAPAINWKARFEKLAESVRYLSESAEYAYQLGCNVPSAEAWEHLDKQLDLLSDETRLVSPLPLPSSSFSSF
jgi:hypothetical protein